MSFSRKFFVYALTVFFTTTSVYAAPTNTKLPPLESKVEDPSLSSMGKVFFFLAAVGILVSAIRPQTGLSVAQNNKRIEERLREAQ